MADRLLSYEEAAALVAGRAARLLERAPETEEVALNCAAGRVLAQPIRTDRDQPPFDRSTRDGFACRAAEASAHARLRVTGMAQAGTAPGGPLGKGEAWEIMTGAPVPAGADAVMMLEHAETADGRVRLVEERRLKPGENVVACGAHGRTGDELLAAGTRVGPGQVALAAACGLARLSVYKRPRVTVLATGDELVDVESVPGPGQIRNSNGPMLAALVETAGGEPWVLERAADNAESLDRALGRTLDGARAADMLLISGGVSAGKFDLVEPALARLGARFHFTGVRMQPGKPTVFGELPRPDGGALPFFGLPGNPVSTMVTFLLFAAPVLRALAAERAVGPRFALARLAGEAERGAKSGLTRFLPAECDFGAEPRATFVPWHGSGDLTALARANCFLVVPEGSGELEEGKKMRILLV